MILAFARTAAVVRCVLDTLKELVVLVVCALFVLVCGPLFFIASTCIIFVSMDANMEMEAKAEAEAEAQTVFLVVHPDFHMSTATVVVEEALVEEALDAIPFLAR